METRNTRFNQNHWVILEKKYLVIPKDKISI